MLHRLLKFVHISYCSKFSIIRKKCKETLKSYSIEKVLVRKYTCKLQFCLI